MEEKTNTACPLHDTKYCSMLNMENCDACTVNGSHKAEMDALRQGLEVTASLMPEEGISDLFTEEKCVLCRGAEKGKKSWYAFCDIGNPEPATEQRNAIGIKAIARTGSLVPLQMSCCEACRKRLLRAEYTPVLTPTIAGVAALGILSINSIREAIMTITPALPFIIFIVVVGAAMLAGSLLRKKMIKDYSKVTYMNVFDLPRMKGMREKDWFEINPSKGGMSRMIFSKNRLKRGLYTGLVKGDGEALQAD